LGDGNRKSSSFPAASSAASESRSNGADETGAPPLGILSGAKSLKFTLSAIER